LTRASFICQSVTALNGKLVANVSQKICFHFGAGGRVGERMVAQWARRRRNANFSSTGNGY
jgi:hypothetical protein